MNQELKEKSEDLLEILQEQIVKSGGKFLKRKELREMTLDELMGICIPNDIDIISTHGLSKRIEEIKKGEDNPKATGSPILHPYKQLEVYYGHGSNDGVTRGKIEFEQG